MRYNHRIQTPPRRRLTAPSPEWWWDILSVTLDPPSAPPGSSIKVNINFYYYNYGLEPITAEYTYTYDGFTWTFKTDLPPAYTGVKTVTLTQTIPSFWIPGSTHTFCVSNESTECATFTVAEAAPTIIKQGEIDIHYIRLPLITDEYVKNGMLTIVNGVLRVYAPTLTARNARLNTADPYFQYCTVDIVGTASPIPWALLIGVIIGAILAGVIIYFVVVRPLKEALQEVAKDIRIVIEEKEAALAEGKIDKATADSINAILNRAAKKAEEAGQDWIYDWVKWLKPIIEMLPMILGVAVVVGVLGAVVSLIRK